MKWQWQAQHLRIRIDEDELARLLQGQVIEQRTVLAAGVGMSYRLALDEVAAAAFQGSLEAAGFILPRAAVQAYAATLPSRAGLDFELATGAQPLALSFDVDVRDSTRRRHPRAS